MKKVSLSWSVKQKGKKYTFLCNKKVLNEGGLFKSLWRMFLCPAGTEKCYTIVCYLTAPFDKFLLFSSWPHGGTVILHTPETALQGERVPMYFLLTMYLPWTNYILSSDLWNFHHHYQWLLISFSVYTFISGVHSWSNPPPPLYPDCRVITRCCIRLSTGHDLIQHLVMTLQSGPCFIQNWIWTIVM